MEIRPMSRSSRFQTAVVALALFAMVATATVCAEVAPHTKGPGAMIPKGNSFAQENQFLRGSCCDSSETLPAGRKAILDGTLSRSKGEGKGFVIHVDSAKTPKGKELPKLKGKDLPLPKDMSDETVEKCIDCCDNPVTIECTVVGGKITKVKSVVCRDVTKPGSKGN